MRDPAPNVDASPRRRSRLQGCAALLIAGFALALVLIGGAAAYWRYANYVPPYTPPLPTMPESNGLDEAIAAASELPSYDLAGLMSFPRETPQKMRGFVTHEKPLLDRVRTTFPMEWQQPLVTRLGEVDLSNHRLIACARFFVAESRIAAADRDHTTALHRALDPIELGVLNSAGAAFRGWTTSYFLISYGTAQLDALALELPQPDMRSALARVRRLRQASPVLSDAFQLERVSQRAQMTQVWAEIAQETPVGQFPAYEGWFDQASPTTVLGAMLVPKRDLLAQADQYWEAVIEQVQKPIRERSVVPLPDHPLAEMLTLEVSDRHLGGFMEYFETGLALLEIRLAVRVHFLETGAYPAALTDISPKWLPEIPLDIWEQPLQYRLVDGKPVVYSLGPDGVDDEGRAFDPNKLDRNSKGDLVFGQLGGLKKAE